MKGIGIIITNLLLGAIATFLLLIWCLLADGKLVVKAVVPDTVEVDIQNSMLSVDVENPSLNVSLDQPVDVHIVR